MDSKQFLLTTAVNYKSLGLTSGEINLMFLFCPCISKMWSAF